MEVDLVAEMTVINPFDFFVQEDAEKVPFVYDAILKKELQPYLETMPSTPLVAKLVEAARRKDIRTIDFIVELNMMINTRLKYLIRMEPGVQAPEETLCKGSGSCRDYAWLLGAVVPTTWHGGAICVGVFDSVDGGCEIAGWALGAGEGFYGSARVGGGVSAGGWLDWIGCDVGIVYR